MSCSSYLSMLRTIDLTPGYLFLKTENANQLVHSSKLINVNTMNLMKYRPLQLILKNHFAHAPFNSKTTAIHGKPLFENLQAITKPLQATRGKQSVYKTSEESVGLRLLEDIIADLHKPVPEHVKKRTTSDGLELSYIPWHAANSLLDSYAPGWNGEVRTLTYGPNDTVTVIYRITINASNATVWRESTGTSTIRRGNSVDPIQMAEAMAFRRVCARFGLGLYLYGGGVDEEPPF